MRTTHNDDLFVNDVYRGVTVPKVWIMTSKCSGKDCVSRLAADSSRTLLADVMGYENRDVEARMCRDLKCDPETSHEIFQELKRFLWLAAAAPDSEMIPSPVIDEAWHCFILFTEDYAAFCREHFGAFLHHTAHRVGEPRSQRVDLIPTIDAMNQYLGGLPSKYWNYLPVEAMVAA